MATSEVKVDISIRKWVLAALTPLHVIQLLLGKELWLPKFTFKIHR